MLNTRYVGETLQLVVRDVCYRPWQVMRPAESGTGTIAGMCSDRNMFGFWLQQQPYCSKLNADGRTVLSWKPVINRVNARCQSGSESAPVVNTSDTGTINHNITKPTVKPKIQITVSPITDIP